MLPTHGRFPYHPWTGRPRWSWPNGAKLAVYLGVNLEHFAFGEGLGAELAPGGPQPDVLNYAWRDWGNRVGAWRMHELFEELSLPASVLINTAMYDYAPELLAAFRKRGDEFVGHGRTNAERQGVLPEAEEALLIAEATQIMRMQEGRGPDRRFGRPGTGVAAGGGRVRQIPAGRGVRSVMRVLLPLREKVARGARRMRGDTPMRPAGVCSFRTARGNSPLIRAAAPPTFSLKGRRDALVGARP